MSTPGQLFSPAGSWADPDTGRPFTYDELLELKLLMVQKDSTLKDRDGGTFTQSGVVQSRHLAWNAWKQQNRCK